jgi:hypothetical protein
MWSCEYIKVSGTQKTKLLTLKEHPFFPRPTPIISQRPTHSSSRVCINHFRTTKEGY